MREDDLPKEILEGIDLFDYFYGFGRRKDSDRYIQKNLFKEDAYRLIVINFHLSIEEMLKSYIYDCLPRRRTLTRKQNIQYVEDLSFKNAINLAARLGILNKRGYSTLDELNTIRNKCSHNWTIGSYKIAKITGRRQRKYKVEFNGKNLLSPKLMKEKFIPLYGDVYIELFSLRYGLRRGLKYTNKV